MAKTVVVPTADELLEEPAAGAQGEVLDDSYGQEERGQAPATPPAETPAATPPVAETPAPEVPPATPPVAPTAPEWSSVRDYAKSLGVDASSFTDDNAYLQHLLLQSERAKQLEQLGQYGNIYLQNAEAFQRFQKAETEAKQKAEQQPVKPKPWQGPEYDQRWEQIIEPTETGGYKVKEGYDPAILPKYLAHREHVRKWTQELVTNPDKALGEWVRDEARSLAREEAQKAMAEQQDRQYRDSFVDRNPWIHAKDAQGNTIQSREGKPVLSAAGERFAQHWNQAEQLGIQGRQAQEQYARAMLRADLLESEKTAAAPAQVAEQQKAAVVAANRTVNRGGSTLAAAGHQAPAQNENLSLREMLANAMAEAGITDESLAS